MPIKAILFDLDGTLVNTLRVFPQLIVEQFSNNPDKKFIKYYLRRIGSFYNLKENDTWIKHSWFNLQLFRTIRADFNLSWICSYLG